METRAGKEPKRVRAGQSLQERLGKKLEVEVEPVMVSAGKEPRAGREAQASQERMGEKLQLKKPQVELTRPSREPKVVSIGQFLQARSTVISAMVALTLVRDERSPSTWRFRQSVQE
jgi:hypothetical protein